LLGIPTAQVGWARPGTSPLSQLLAAMAIKTTEKVCRYWRSLNTVGSKKESFAITIRKHREEEGILMICILDFPYFAGMISISPD
jgi:hypothetical protein